MKVREITDIMEEVAPLGLQEAYDNSGLITGSKESEVKGVLLTLDVTEAVIKEAIVKKCNMIISHHPPVFTGLKKFNGSTYTERVVIEAIKNDIILYACHTNLDNVLQQGVNQHMASKLQLQQQEILRPLSHDLQKIITYCPEPYVLQVQEAVWSAGGGNVGKYSQCSFSVKGQGTFMPGNEADPFMGTIGERETCAEEKLEFLVTSDIADRVLNAMMEAHPYEEVAYEQLSLNNKNHQRGAGIKGILPEDLSQTAFLDLLQQHMQLQVIAYTPLSENKRIRKVGICGGSGRFLLPDAIRHGLDAFVTSDIKYHEYFDADGKILLCNIGHHESEKYTVEIFMKIIKEKFPTFAVLFSDTNTNPIKYHI
jgi:dinuclear metal center YbgI/SA1388 family protein